MQAILEKNYPVFAELTMKDSNQFHAVCLDTYPPCFYMNDVSHSIVSVIHRYNEAHGAIKVRWLPRHDIRLCDSNYRLSNWTICK